MWLSSDWLISSMTSEKELLEESLLASLCLGSSLDFEFILTGLELCVQKLPKLDIFWSLERVETRLDSCLPDKSSEKARVRLSFWEGLGRLTYVVGEEVASVQLIIVFSLGRIEFVRAAYIKFVRSSLVLLVGEGVMKPLAS